MKWFRFRLSTLLWLVAIAAVFLGGVRYGEYRQAVRTKPMPKQYNITLSYAESAEFESKMKLVLPVKPHTRP